MAACGSGEVPLAVVPFHVTRDFGPTPCTETAVLLPTRLALPVAVTTRCMIADDRGSAAGLWRRVRRVGRREDRRGRESAGPRPCSEKPVIQQDMLRPWCRGAILGHVAWRGDRNSPFAK
jgi:hypothetical protein